MSGLHLRFSDVGDVARLLDEEFGRLLAKDPLTMLNYEIRYLTSDDKVAIIYNTLQSGDRDAVLTAAKPVRLRYKLYEVWRGDECVGRGINPRLPN